MTVTRAVCPSAIGGGRRVRRCDTLTMVADRGQTRRMARLYRVDNGETIGQINDKQLQFLVDMLEEEDEEDQDYYIDADTLELFSDNGCDPELLALLEGALEDGEDGVDIAWE
jgi:hypothetical protein